VTRPILAVILALLIVAPALAQGKRRGKARFDQNFGPAVATPIEQIKALKDFRVELLYSVPREQGSWVSMCLDPQGRLIVSDQEGSLYRVTLPAGQVSNLPAADGQVENLAHAKVERIPLDIGDAQGLLWAFDSLYVVVNSLRIDSGLYRVRDTNGDGELDDVKLLRKLDGGGEHGPHAVLLAPDGKSLTVVCGNQAKLTEFAKSRVPPVWGEDHLLPRMPDGNGFMRGVLGPGGVIYQVDPDGQKWEIIAVGLRNHYDAAYNRHGDLFTYDADMEWDFGTPWYRPTRVCLCASGGEFGWRNGAGKWPPYYPDSLPAVVDIGPGSPTGVTFGYGAKFPAKYQEASFICDWSYGKLYAVHLEPEGSAYKGTFEEFVSGTPLPLTDLVIRPQDGAMYFAIGGRGIQSGLYRVTYAGSESTAPARPDGRFADQRALRRQLESFHGRKDPAAVDVAWPYLSHDDRYLRHAARVAVEHQDAESWWSRALSEKEPQAALNALLALVRVSGRDPFHHPSRPPVDEKLKGEILAALERLDWARLTTAQRLDLLRVYHVLFNRMGPPNKEVRERLIARFDPIYPAQAREINAELCQLMVYLEARSVVAKTLGMMSAAPTQEEQIEYARALRVLKTGWTLDQRKEYFTWFLKSPNFKQGSSLGGLFKIMQARRSAPGDSGRLGGSLRGFFKIMHDDAVASLTSQEKEALRPILEAQPPTQTFVVAEPKPFVKKWTLDELLPLVEKGLTKRDYDRGRTLFGAANCFACHRFNGEGSSHGPDLTGLAGRFSLKDLLESVVDPSKVVSDQYQAVVIRTIDGQVITGRIVSQRADVLHINTDMLNPSGQVSIDRRQIEEMQPSKVSMMPIGLLDSLHDDEVLDLVAFLLSRGDRNHLTFQ
jgi:putative heme-binding domain-containing protein